MKGDEGQEGGPDENLRREEEERVGTINFGCPKCSQARALLARRTDALQEDVMDL